MPSPAVRSPPEQVRRVLSRPVRQGWEPWQPAVWPIAAWLPKARLREPALQQERCGAGWPAACRAAGLRQAASPPEPVASPRGLAGQGRALRRERRPVRCAAQGAAAVAWQGRSAWRPVAGLLAAPVRRDAAPAGPRESRREPAASRDARQAAAHDPDCGHGARDRRARAQARFAVRLGRWGAPQVGRPEPGLRAVPAERPAVLQALKGQRVRRAAPRPAAGAVRRAAPHGAARVPGGARHGVLRRAAHRVAADGPDRVRTPAGPAPAAVNATPPLPAGWPPSTKAAPFLQATAISSY